MRRISAFVLLPVAALLLAPMSSLAGAGPAPEIDPGSLAGGVALVMTSAAVILERRRRR
ncbi:MAG: hypothetical protein ABI565_07510 [Vicinamibacteria bacterium]